MAVLSSEPGKRLSDVTLAYWAAAAETAPPGELGTVNWPTVAKMLIAELRASHAREQELQQRIDPEHPEDPT